MLGKLVDGNLVIAHGKYIEYDGMIITNPREEDWRMAGYKDVIDGEHLPPREGYCERPVYSDDGDVIRTTYEYREIIEDDSI